MFSNEAYFEQNALRGNVSAFRIVRLGGAALGSVVGLGFAVGVWW
jgi:hypothetical protein